MTFRYAIFTAVSTEAQASTDKVSLSEQESKCRSLAESRNWIDTALTYTVPGESRTRWINLRDAEREIPALASMLDDAQAGKYDLLLLYDYNRLRDLLQPVSKTLSHYGVQLYSLAQPVEPVDPAQYRPYLSDASTMMQGMSSIISQAQIADLRRKHAYAMPRRISYRGLHANTPPWGYIKPPGRETDRTAIPIQDPAKCAILLNAVELLLSGHSLRSIVEDLNQAGTPPPRRLRWHPQTLRRILTNPYYAGVVTFGAHLQRTDPRTGQTRSTLNPHPITGVGKHVPLWDLATRDRILDELVQHRKGYAGRRNNQLTGLLYCSSCGSKMWIYYNNRAGGLRNPTWRCSGHQRHPSAKVEQLLPIVSARIAADIRRLLHDLEHAPSHPNQDKSPGILADLLAQRTRLEDAYQAGILPLSTFGERLGSLETEIEKLTRNVNRADHDQRAHTEKLEILRRLAASPIQPLLETGDPVEINKLLKTLISKIILTGLEITAIEYK